MGCKLEGAFLIFPGDLAHCRHVSLYIYHPSLIIQVPLKNHILIQMAQLKKFQTASLKQRTNAKKTCLQQAGYITRPFIKEAEFYKDYRQGG